MRVVTVQAGHGALAFKKAAGLAKTVCCTYDLESIVVSLPFRIVKSTA